MHELFLRKLLTSNNCFFHFFTHPIFCKKTFNKGPENISELHVHMEGCGKRWRKSKPLEDCRQFLMDRKIFQFSKCNNFSYNFYNSYTFAPTSFQSTHDCFFIYLLFLRFHFDHFISSPVQILKFNFVNVRQHFR